MAHFRPAFARLQERPPLKNLCVSRLFGVCLGNLQELSLPAWAFTVRKDKNIVHNIRGSDLRFVVQMTVNIRRRADVTVTEPFLNLLHRYVIGKQQRRAAVPEIVKPNVPQTISFQNLAEILRNRVGIEDSSHSINKDIAVVFAVVTIPTDTPVLFLPLFQFQKFFSEVTHQRERTKA